MGTSKNALVLGLLLFTGQAFAASADIDWNMEPMDPDLGDLPSLQRGAALFTNFCIGCHSLKYQRYERTADDIGIPHDVALRNLVLSDQQIGALMETAMPPAQAKNWFGAPPPDLTMVARVRGPEWIYNMLKTFYVDESRPFGVNNKVFDNIGMPHALITLQGTPTQVCGGAKVVDILDGETGVLDPDGEVVVEPDCGDIAVDGSGLYDEQEYDQAVYDIANFLHYVGDPSRAERESLGWWVLGFLLVLFVISSFLNREYWKAIH